MERMRWSGTLHDGVIGTPGPPAGRWTTAVWCMGWVHSPQDHGGSSSETSLDYTGLGGGGGSITPLPPVPLSLTHL